MLNYNVTNEDLDKATAVRIFEKLGAVDQKSITLQESPMSNQFSDEMINAFEKQASAEGIDLNTMSDDELTGLYNHFLSLVKEQNEPSQTEVTEAQENGQSARIVREQFHGIT